MFVEQYTPVTPHSNAKYLPLPVKEIDTNNNQSPPSPCPHHAYAWRIKLMKYMPFCVHFALTMFVATICLGVLDGRSFNINSRRPQFTEADGSLSRVESYFPLQSDIVTAVSVAATTTRVAGGWWAAGYIWRCIFMTMEDGGISLEGLLQVLSHRPPAPRHFARQTHMIIIYITIIATFSIDYFSAVLTGSFMWESADMLIPGRVPLAGIPRGFRPQILIDNYFTHSDERTWVLEGASAAANHAWVEPQANSISHYTQPATTFRRVIREGQYLLVNSTLANVTIPFFAVDAFQWIQDPDQVLKNQQVSLFSDYTEFSPYISGKGVGGLLPDSNWGPTDSATKTRLDPHIVSETRLFTFRVYRLYPVNGTVNIPMCPQNYTVDPGTNVNLYTINVKRAYTDCFAIAKMTYRAGVATCNHCKLISPTILDTQGPLSLAPDVFTSMALAVTPSVGTNLIISNYSVPWNHYPTQKDFIIEFTSRAYQATWAAFSEFFGDKLDSTSVDIAIATLRLRIILWRVHLWVALHISVLILGLLFVYMQSSCRHPWVEDPTMAIFWLDTSAVHGSQSHAVDPWQRGTEICRKGMLVLDEAGERSRSVKIKRA